MESEDKLLTEVYSILGKDGVTNLSELVIGKCNELQLSQRQFSSIVGVERKSLNRIFEGEAQKVDIVTLLKLSHFLKKPIDDVIRVYIYSLTPETLSDIERTRKASFIVENFDLTGMKKAGVLDDISDFELIEERIKKFFGLETIFEY